MSILDTLTVVYQVAWDHTAAGEVQSGIERLKNNLRPIGQMIGGLTKLGAATGAISLKMAMDFDRSYTKLRTQLSLTADEIDRARKLTRKLSDESGKSLRDLADAYFSLRSAGLSEKDAVEGLAASVHGAVIELGSVAQIADVAAASVNAFGASGLTATKAVQQLHKAIKEGKIRDATDVTAALPRMLSQARELNVKPQELLSIIALGSRIGRKPTDIATSLRQLMAQTLAPSRQAQEWYAERGIQQATVLNLVKERGISGYVHILRRLIESSSGSTSPAERTAVLGKNLRIIYGDVTAINQVLGVTGQRVDQLNQIRDSLEDMSDFYPSVQYALDQSYNKFDRLGNALKNTIGDLGSSIMWVTDAFTALPNSIKTAIGLFSTLQLSAAFGLIPTFGRMLFSIWEITSGIIALNWAYKTFLATAMGSRFAQAAKGVARRSVSQTSAMLSGAAATGFLSFAEFTRRSKLVPNAMKISSKSAQNMTKSMGRLWWWGSLFAKTTITSATFMAKSLKTLVNMRWQLLQVAGLATAVFADNALVGLLGLSGLIGGQFGVMRQRRKPRRSVGGLGVEDALLASLFARRRSPIWGRILRTLTRFKAASRVLLGSLSSIARVVRFLHPGIMLVVGAFMILYARWKDFAGWVDSIFILGWDRLKSAFMDLRYYALDPLLLTVQKLLFPMRSFFQTIKTGLEDWFGIASEENKIQSLRLRQWRAMQAEILKLQHQGMSRQDAITQLEESYLRKGIAFDVKNRRIWEIGDEPPPPLQDVIRRRPSYYGLGLPQIKQDLEREKSPGKTPREWQEAFEKLEDAEVLGGGIGLGLGAAAYKTRDWIKDRLKGKKVVDIGEPSDPWLLKRYEDAIDAWDPRYTDWIQELRPRGVVEWASFLTSPPTSHLGLRWYLKMLKGTFQHGPSVIIDDLVSAAKSVKSDLDFRTSKDLVPYESGPIKYEQGFLGSLFTERHKGTQIRKAHLKRIGRYILETIEQTPEDIDVIKELFKYYPEIMYRLDLGNVLRKESIGGAFEQISDESDFKNRVRTGQMKELYKWMKMDQQLREAAPYIWNRMQEHMFILMEDLDPPRLRSILFTPMRSAFLESLSKTYSATSKTYKGVKDFVQKTKEAGEKTLNSELFKHKVARAIKRVSQDQSKLSLAELDPTRMWRIGLNVAAGTAILSLLDDDPDNDTSPLVPGLLRAGIPFYEWLAPKVIPIDDEYKEYLQFHQVMQIQEASYAQRNQIAATLRQIDYLDRQSKTVLRNIIKANSGMDIEHYRPPWFDVLGKLRLWKQKLVLQVHEQELIVAQQEHYKNLLRLLDDETIPFSDYMETLRQEAPKDNWLARFDLEEADSLDPFKKQIKENIEFLKVKYRQATPDFLSQVAKLRHWRFVGKHAKDLLAGFDDMIHDTAKEEYPYEAVRPIEGKVGKYTFAHSDTYSSTLKSKGKDAFESLTNSTEPVSRMLARAYRRFIKQNATSDKGAMKHHLRAIGNIEIAADLLEFFDDDETNDALNWWAYIARLSATGMDVFDVINKVHLEREMTSNAEALGLLHNKPEFRDVWRDIKSIGKGVKGFFHGVRSALARRAPVPESLKYRWGLHGKESLYIDTRLTPAEFGLWMQLNKERLAKSKSSNFNQTLAEVLSRKNPLVDRKLIRDNIKILRAKVSRQGTASSFTGLGSNLPESWTNLGFWSRGEEPYSERAIKKILQSLQIITKNPSAYQPLGLTGKELDQLVLDFVNAGERKFTYEQLEDALLVGRTKNSLPIKFLKTLISEVSFFREDGFHRNPYRGEELRVHLKRLARSLLVDDTILGKGMLSILRFGAREQGITVLELLDQVKEFRGSGAAAFASSYLRGEKGVEEMVNQEYLRLLHKSRLVKWLNYPDAAIERERMLYPSWEKNAFSWLEIQETFPRTDMSLKENRFIRFLEEAKDWVAKKLFSDRLGITARGESSLLRDILSMDKGELLTKITEKAKAVIDRRAHLFAFRNENNPIIDQGDYTYRLIDKHLDSSDPMMKHLYYTFIKPFEADLKEIEKLEVFHARDMVKLETSTSVEKEIARRMKRVFDEISLLIDLKILTRDATALHQETGYVQIAQKVYRTLKWLHDWKNKFHGKDSSSSGIIHNEGEGWTARQARKVIHWFSKWKHSLRSAWMGGHDVTGMLVEDLEHFRNIQPSNLKQVANALEPYRRDLLAIYREYMTQLDIKQPIEAYRSFIDELAAHVLHSDPEMLDHAIAAEFQSTIPGSRAVAWPKRIRRMVKDMKVETFAKGWRAFDRAKMRLGKDLNFVQGVADAIKSLAGQTGSAHKAYDQMEFYIEDQLLYETFKERLTQEEVEARLTNLIDRINIESIQHKIEKLLPEKDLSSAEMAYKKISSSKGHAVHLLEDSVGLTGRIVRRIMGMSDWIVDRFYDAWNLADDIADWFRPSRYRPDGFAGETWQHTVGRRLREMTGRASRDDLMKRAELYIRDESDRVIDRLLGRGHRMKRAQEAADLSRRSRLSPQDRLIVDAVTNLNRSLQFELPDGKMFQAVFGSEYDAFMAAVRVIMYNADNLLFRRMLLLAPDVRYKFLMDSLPGYENYIRSNIDKAARGYGIYGPSHDSLGKPDQPWKWNPVKMARHFLQQYREGMHIIAQEAHFMQLEPDGFEESSRFYKEQTTGFKGLKNRLYYMMQALRETLSPWYDESGEYHGPSRDRQGLWSRFKNFYKSLNRPLGIGGDEDEGRLAKSLKTIIDSIDDGSPLINFRKSITKEIKPWIKELRWIQDKVFQKLIDQRKISRPVATEKMKWIIHDLKKIVNASGASEADRYMASLVQSGQRLLPDWTDEADSIFNSLTPQKFLARWKRHIAFMKRLDGELMAMLHDLSIILGEQDTPERISSLTRSFKVMEEFESQLMVHRLSGMGDTSLKKLFDENAEVLRSIANRVLAKEAVEEDALWEAAGLSHLKHGWESFEQYQRAESARPRSMKALDKFFKGFGRGTEEYATRIFDAIKDTTGHKLNFLGGESKGMLARFIRHGDFPGRRALSTLSRVTATISKAIARAAGHAIRSRAERMWGGTMSMVNRAWEGIKYPFENPRGFFSTIGRGLTYPFRHPIQFLEGMGRGIKSMGRFAWGGIKKLARWIAPVHPAELMVDFMGSGVRATIEETRMAETDPRHYWSIQKRHPWINGIGGIWDSMEETWWKLKGSKGLSPMEEEIMEKYPEHYSKYKRIINEIFTRGEGLTTESIGFGNVHRNFQRHPFAVSDREVDLYSIPITSPGAVPVAQPRIYMNSPAPQTTIHVHQQPGEDGEQLARNIARQLGNEIEDITIENDHATERNQ